MRNKAVIFVMPKYQLHLIFKLSYCFCADEYKKEIWAFSKLGQFSNEAEKFQGSINTLKEKLNEFQENEEKILAQKKSVDVSNLIY